MSLRAYFEWPPLIVVLGLVSMTLAVGNCGERLIRAWRWPPGVAVDGGAP